MVEKLMLTQSIALTGDYDLDVAAHRTIPLAIELAARETKQPLLVSWLPTKTRKKGERAANRSRKGRNGSKRMTHARSV